jgi:hypothetical protein
MGFGEGRQPSAEDLANSATSSKPRSMMKLGETASEAALLDEESRASLASRLLRSLSAGTGTVSDEEVTERIREAGDDPGVTLDLDRFLSGINGR